MKGPNDVKSLFPLAKTDDIKAGFYVKDDGRVNPVDAAMALAKGARMKGVKIFEDVTVTDITTCVDKSRINKKVSYSFNCSFTSEFTYIFT